MKTVGRNDPCPCGSKKKYKKCCFVPEKPSALRSLHSKVSHSGSKSLTETFAKKVLKVISAPPSAPVADEPSSCGVSSLEELIGLEPSETIEQKPSTMV